MVKAEDLIIRQMKDPLKRRQKQSGKIGNLSEKEVSSLRNLYSKNSSAVYGGVKTLKEASGLPIKKINEFLQKIAAHTKYGPFR